MQHIMRAVVLAICAVAASTSASATQPSFASRDERLGAAWDTHEPPQLTVITSVIASDIPNLHGFSLNVRRQRLRVPWELLVASESTAALAVIRAALGPFVANASCRLRLRILNLESDIGLYETWDMLAGIAAAPVLTNWNVDDRKDPEALATKLALLHARPSVAVVSSAVKVVWPNGPTPSWAHSTASPRGAKRALWYSGFSGPLTPEHFVKLGANLSVKQIQNPPHNSPMWRRAIHADPRIGIFSDRRFGLPLSEGGKAASCADWALWIRVLLANRTIWHLNEPIELYAARRTSHNRRQPELHARCTATGMKQLMPALQGLRRMTRGIVSRKAARILTSSGGATPPQSKASMAMTAAMLPVALPRTERIRRVDATKLKFRAFEAAWAASINSTAARVAARASETERARAEAEAAPWAAWWWSAPKRVPSVSALCVTRRPDLLRRSLGLFQAQTHPSKHIVVVTRADRHTP